MGWSVFCKLVFCLLFGLSSITTYAQSLQRMSLQDCIAYAIANNMDVTNARLGMEASHRIAQQGYSNVLPNVEASANLNYSLEVPTSFIPAELSGGESGTFIPVKFAPAYSGRALLNLEQVVFSGSAFIAIRAAESYKGLAKKQQIKAEQDVVEMVSKSFYLCLINQERGKMIIKTHQRLDSLLLNTETMHEAGVVESIDVDRVRVQYNNAKVERDNFQRTLDLSYSTLKFYMGMEQSDGLALEGSIEHVKYEALDLKMEENFAYEDRIEYRLLQNQLENIHYEIKNTLWQYAPVIHFTFSYGANTSTSNIDHFFDFSNRWFGQATLGLRISMPIFDGLKKHRLVQQKRIEELQKKNSMKRLQQNIDLEIVRFKSTLLKSIDNMTIQKINMELAENVYKAAEIKYEEGVGSNTDLMEADESYTRARTNYYAALYDALLAKIDLEKTYGTLHTP